MNDPITPDTPTGTFQIRDAERREIWGRIVPYGETITIRGRNESFAYGAFASVDPAKVRLLMYHDPRRPVGRGVAIEEREDGAYMLFRVSRTQEGDEALALAADDVLNQFSPGFFPVTQTRSGTHTRSHLAEVSLTTFAAYQGAQVLAVRQEEEEMPEEITPVVEGFDLPAPFDPTALETRMAGFAATLEQLASQTAPQVRPARGPSAIDWFRAQLDAQAGEFQRRDALREQWANFQTRAPLADITGEFPPADPDDDLSALVLEEFLGSQLVNVLDTRRPLFSRMGSFPMPRSGYARIPVVTQHTLVAPRAGQKADANSRKMIVTTLPFEAVWYDGAVDIALEVIRTADLGVIEMVWNDLLGQYAVATNAGVVAAIEAGGQGFVYTGTALDTADYPGFAADVATQAIAVRNATGAPATALAVTEAQWPLLVAMVDANDRRIFAPIGAQNADASVGFTGEAFTLPGGIEVFYAPGLTQAVLFNTDGLKVADGGPERVEARNVLEMGQDLGILGRTMFVPRIPAGVVVFGADPES
jgi:HK97 family phage prohead protease